MYHKLYQPDIALTSIGDKTVRWEVALSGRKDRINLSEKEIERKTWNDELNNALSRLKSTACSSDDVCWGDIQNSAREYLEATNTLIPRLFGFREIQKVKKVFSNIFNRSMVTGRVPTLELVSNSGEPYLVELLPLNNWDCRVRIDSMQSFSDFLMRFPAFTCRIGRRIAKCMNSEAGVLMNTRSTNLRFFHHAGLPGAQKEIDVFRDWEKDAENLIVYGPWPNECLSEADLVEAVARQLWNPRLQFDGSQGDWDHIQHFACHCFTRRRDSEEFFLELSHDGTVMRRLRLKDLRAKFYELAMKEPAGFQPNGMPLVFLNACGTHSKNCNGNSSFAHFLTENQNLGVIGTEVDVHDDYASVFSQYFYKRFLGGVRLADALLGARWDAAKLHRNPIGLLYTAFGHPNVSVLRKIKL